MVDKKDCRSGEKCNNGSRAAALALIVYEHDRIIRKEKGPAAKSSSSSPSSSLKNLSVFGMP